MTLACVFPHLNFQRDSRYFNTVNHVCLWLNNNNFQHLKSWYKMDMILTHTHTHTKNLYYSTELTLLNHINDCDLILKSLEGKSTFLPQNTLTFNPLTWLIKQTFTYTVGWHISCKDNYDIKCAAEKSALHRELLSFISNNEINNWPFPWVKVTWTRAQRIICNTH